MDGRRRGELAQIVPRVDAGFAEGVADDVLTARVTVVEDGHRGRLRNVLAGVDVDGHEQLLTVAGLPEEASRRHLRRLDLRVVGAEDRLEDAHGHVFVVAALTREVDDLRRGDDGRQTEAASEPQRLVDGARRRVVQEVVAAGVVEHVRELGVHRGA